MYVFSLIYKRERERERVSTYVRDVNTRIVANVINAI